MNESDVDSWYDEEKERLVDRYLAELQRGRNRDSAKKNFSSSFKRLHKTYEKRMGDIIELQKWLAKMNPADKRWKGIVSFFR